MSVEDLLVIGAGAAGIFAAVNAKQMLPALSVRVLEKSAKFLTKVAISGGGRCNVTHNCFEPSELVRYYPRGHRELLGPFHHFGPKETIEWFTARGVPLKVEADGRLFPESDDSGSIIQCLMNQARHLGVEILMRQNIVSIERNSSSFCVHTLDQTFQCRNLLLATGSGADGYKWAEAFGHQIMKPVPSLFAFNIPTSPLLSLSGLSVDKVLCSFKSRTCKQSGPLLCTHFGFSGPAILRLSAWEARYLNECGYKTELIICWLGEMERKRAQEILFATRKSLVKKTLLSLNPFLLPKKLWSHFLQTVGLESFYPAQISNESFERLADKLCQDSYQMEGKTTHKEEFVTCGGVSLKAIDFKRMESKILPGLYFAGEILDIDGVTGGFNFQNCWTTAFLVAKSLAQK